MHKLLALLAAAAFAISTGAIAQTPAAAPAKAAAAAAPAAAAPAAAVPVKLEKPASVAQAAWDKMSDADKKQAVEKAAKAAPVKKEKKGGC